MMASQLPINDMEYILNNPYEVPIANLDLNAGEEFIPTFYGVSTTKLIIMSVVTFSFYNIYWFFKNFTAYKRKYNDGSIPFLRALFSPIFSYSLFVKVKTEMENAELTSSLPAGPLAAAYFSLHVLGRALSEPLSLIGVLNFIPLIKVNAGINKLHLKEHPGYVTDSKLSLYNWLFIVPGVILIALVIVGLFVRDK